MYTNMATSQSYDIVIGKYNDMVIGKYTNMLTSKSTAIKVGK